MTVHDPALAGEPAASHVIETVEAVTPVVVGAMARAPDARLREIMAALVKHLHAFAQEVKLTEAEYETGVAFLNRIGQATTATHNEGMLAADALGLSTLVCLMNNGNAGATETAAALLGPFWRMHSPQTPSGDSILRSPTPGPALFARFRVLDIHRKPVEGVEVDVWHSSPVGFYDNQDPLQADMNLRGKFTTDADGRFGFRSVKPGPYPVPTDGPIGDLLRAQRRHPYRPAHLHLLLFKPGYKTLITQLFVADDPYLQSDVVFGVTKALIGDYRRHEAGEPPPAADGAGPWYSIDSDLVMEPGDAKLPMPPIQ